MLHRITPALCLFALAACSPSGTDVQKPIDVGTPGTGSGSGTPPVTPPVAPPVDGGGRDRDTTSILDGASPSERGASDVDELDYIHMSPEEAA